MTHYDLVVIGSGAGFIVADAALGKGLKCALIEDRKVGGTCLNKGCIPSKMLVYPTDFLRNTRRSSRIGINVKEVEYDWDRISYNVWKQIDFNKVLEKNLKNMENLDLFLGHASFVDAHTVKISYSDGRPDQIISGDKFLIAGGARSFVPKIEGVDSKDYITSETFFGERYPDKPYESLAIVGSGAIGMEFASIFAALGTKITLIVRGNRILTKEDEEVAEFAAKQMDNCGIDILTQSNVTDIKTEGGRRKVTILNKETGQEKILDCQEIMFASGVVSNADSMGLDKAGVEVDERGWIKTNPKLETSQKHIWAIGDINGKFQLRHKSNYEAGILARNLFSDQEELEEADYSATPWAIFSNPQIAHVGMTEQEVKDAGIEYRTAKNYYSEVVAGMAMGFRDKSDDNGFVKVIVDMDKKILGVHIAGPDAAALIQPYVYMMSGGKDSGTYDIVSKAMTIHPSLGELTAWVFEKLEF